MAEKNVLKKYANRRIYDTAKSAYVTLEQVAEMIRKGRQVEVIDAKTHEDVTAFILTQIVLEEAKRKNLLLPVPLLHMLIQYGGNVLDEFFDKYLEQTLKSYLSYKREVDEQFSKWLDLGTDISEMTRRAMTGSMPFQAFFGEKGDSGEKEEEKEPE